MKKFLLAAALLLPTEAFAVEPVCTMAAGRILASIEKMAAGTRHEAQISQKISGTGRGKIIAEIASGMTEDQCAFFMLMSDDAIDGLAVGALPELVGD